MMISVKSFSAEIKIMTHKKHFLAEFKYLNDFFSKKNDGLRLESSFAKIFPSQWRPFSIKQCKKR